jgi:hypothetical protein
MTWLSPISPFDFSGGDSMATESITMISTAFERHQHRQFWRLFTGVWLRHNQIVDIWLLLACCQGMSASIKAAVPPAFALRQMVRSVSVVLPELPDHKF